MVDLTEYDVIVVNTSAGKDSLTMLAEVTRQAVAAGVKHRVVAVHADLGRVEWQGTRDLAERQAQHFGVQFLVVRREQDLLDHVEQRGMWPSSTARYCTSDHKRDQVAKVIRALSAAIAKRKPGKHIRVLNCLGLRAEESPARAKRLVTQKDARLTTAGRTVVTWHPILKYRETAVWSRIERDGLGDLVHEAYKLGMPRLSCCFCVFAPKSALVCAGLHNPELLQAYVDVEKKTGHQFRVGLSLQDVQKAVQEGRTEEKVEGWVM